MPVFCFAVKKGSLDDHMRDVLFLGAVQLMRDRSARKTLKSPRLSGLIRTAFQRAMLGTIGGTKFAAALETERGSVEVTYIVRDEDIAAEIESGAHAKKTQRGSDGTWTDFGLVFDGEEFEEYQSVAPSETFDN